MEKKDEKKKVEKIAREIKNLEPKDLEKVFYIMQGMRIAEKSMSVAK